MLDNFGEEFKEDGIIGETRLSIEDVFGKIKKSESSIPKDSDDLDLQKMTVLSHTLRELRSSGLT